MRRFLKPQHLLLVAFIAGVIQSGTELARAATLEVDMGESNQTAQGEVQAGFVAWDLTGPTSPQTLPLIDPFGTGDNVTVTLSTNNAPFGTGTGTRDRGVVGPNASALSNLLRDFIFETDNSSVTLNFSGLPAGDYVINTFHHDDDFAQGNADVFLSDALVTNLAVGNANTTTNGNLPNFGTFTTSFIADGLSDVSLRFDTNGNQMFNGFSLDFTAAVPEPTSIAIWVLIGLALSVFGYTRFRKTK